MTSCCINEYLDSFSSQATSKKAKEEKAHGFGRKLDAEKIIGATNEPGPNIKREKDYLQYTFVMSFLVTEVSIINN